MNDISVCSLCKKSLSKNAMKFFTGSNGYFPKEDLFCIPDEYHQMSSFHEPMSKLEYLESRYKELQNG